MEKISTDFEKRRMKRMLNKAAWSRGRSDRPYCPTRKKKPKWRSDYGE